MKSLTVSSLVVGSFHADEMFLAASEKTACASVSVERGDKPSLVLTWPNARVEVPVSSLSRTSILGTKNVKQTIIRLHFESPPKVDISLFSAPQHQSATMPPALCSELTHAKLYEVLVEHAREDISTVLGSVLQESARFHLPTPFSRSRERAPVLPEAMLTRSRVASRSPRPVQVCRPKTTRGLEGLGRSSFTVCH